MSTYPLKLVPRMLPKPWGGTRIFDRFGKGPGDGSPIGESWELFDRPDGSAVIANGEFAGRDLAALRGEFPIPLLTKFIDAREPLSVQVHPDHEAAEELSSEAKAEAWYILESEPGALIYKGLRPGVNAAKLLRAVREGTVEECLHAFHPEPGDVIYLPAGTVHALGAGVLLFEVLQNADTTYRLDDWNRKGLDGEPRELHVKSAIRCADFLGPGLDRIEPRLIGDDGCHRATVRVSCPEFILEEHRMMGLTTLETERRGRDTWHVLTILSGEGAIRPFRRGAGEAFFAPGDTILLPAEHSAYELEPRPGQTVNLLSAHVPH